MGPDALLKQKVAQKRFREGYEEGASSTHRALPAATFVMGDSPVEMLGQFTQIAVEGPNALAGESVCVSGREGGVRAG